MPARKIFWDWVGGKILLSDASPAEVPNGFWNFGKYSKIPLCIALIEPKFPYGLGDYARVDITDVTLKVTVDNMLDTAAPKVEQAVWTKDTANMTFSAVVDLNTVLFNAYVLASEGLEPYFQIEATSPTFNAKYRRTCKIFQSITQPVTVSPDPTKVYPTLDEIAGMFVPRVMGPGESLTLQDGDGQVLRVIGVRRDGTPQDDGG